MKERIVRLCARGKIAINLRGMESLQSQPGEDEDTAWRRLRPKLSFTGRQLDEVFLLPPSAVPSTGGATPPVPGVTDPAPGGGLFGGPPTTDSPPSPIYPPVAGPTDGTEPSSSGGIFGGGGSQPRVRLSNPPTSALNLIGRLEGWGIGPATPVGGVTLVVSAATGAQLKELLRKLPDGMTFELSLDKEED